MSQGLPAKCASHGDWLKDESRRVQTGLLACLFKAMLLTIVMLIRQGDDDVLNVAGVLFFGQRH